RYEIPIHTTNFDRDNNFGGSTLFFWGVSKPIEHQGAVYWGWNRVGRWGYPGTLVRSQGHFMASDNILTEKDPRQIKWRILPDSDEGLRAPKGPIAEEINLVAMSDGKFYATYRTIDGYLCHAYSRDNGHTWTPPAYATYGLNSRPIKHPRAYAPVWKLKNGKYLLWFHNHGGEAAHTPEWGRGGYYQNRNPVWALGGVEKNGSIQWSEPEILLYDDDPKVRMSYPDLIEDSGRVYITETQKTIARVHEIDPAMLEGMWNQFENKQLAQKGLISSFPAAKLQAGSKVKMPALPNLTSADGFTIDMRIRFKELNPGQNILDTRDASGKGISLTTSDRFTLKLTLNDGNQQSEWESDPGTFPGSLRINTWHHISVIVDARAKIMSFVVDGVFNDGGAARQFGWGRLNPALGDVNGSKEAKIAQSLWGEIGTIRFYNRPLRTSEAVGNFRAGD
ncbi:MAG: exo-alpha-sialidase, partial [Chloracidobacterium sp.]|nr:exo-alpha-sialidase [Chloracidobacterium sp.]